MDADEFLVYVECIPGEHDCREDRTCPPWHPEHAYECTKAARNGDLERLQQLRAEDPPSPWDTDTCKWAAAHGHLHVLQWIRAQDPPCPWGDFTCDYTASRGLLHILQWLRAQNPPCPWYNSTCRLAAWRGHLHVLQWLRAQDPPCEWDATTCELAAAGNNLNVLQWLRGQNPPCPWDGMVCTRAVSERGIPLLQWALSQDPPCPWTDEQRRVVSLNGYVGSANIDVTVRLRDTYGISWGADGHYWFLMCALDLDSYSHIRWAMTDAERCGISLRPMWADDATWLDIVPYHTLVRRATQYVRAVDDALDGVLHIRDLRDLVTAML